MKLLRVLASTNVSNGSSTAPSTAPVTRRREVRPRGIDGPDVAASGLIVHDGMDVEVAGHTRRARANSAAAVEQGAKPRPAGGAEHELRDVLGVGEGNKCAGDVVADDLVIRAAERLDQQPVGGEHRGVRAGETVGRRNMQRQKVGTTAGGDTSRSSDQRLALGAAGDGHENAFARFPCLGDLMLVPVVLKRVVDFVSYPQQRELAQVR